MSCTCATAARRCQRYVPARQICRAPSRVRCARAPALCRLIASRRKSLPQKRKCHSVLTPFLFRISFNHSRIKLKKIKDGQSHTYMIGEKHLGRRFYENGESGGDDGTIYASHNSDMYRSTYFAPQRDALSADSNDDYKKFGSAHTSSFHMAMCDGSLRPIGYSIDALTHQASGTRHGGEVY